MTRKIANRRKARKEPMTFDDVGYLIAMAVIAVSFVALYFSHGGF